ncbi:Thioredoxin-like domain [Orobanche minor]
MASSNFWMSVLLLAFAVAGTISSAEELESKEFVVTLDHPNFTHFVAKHKFIVVECGVGFNLPNAKVHYEASRLLRPHGDDSGDKRETRNNNPYTFNAVHIGGEKQQAIREDEKDMDKPENPRERLSTFLATGSAQARQKIALQGLRVLRASR